MDGKDFVRIAIEAYAPFLNELGFSMATPSINARFYDVEFNCPQHRVSLSFEPGDWAIFVIVFGREHGRWTDIDDSTKTPRLSDLNARYMDQVSKEERAANEAVFECVVARDEYERLLLKYAKELRLVLPRHMASRGA